MRRRRGADGLIGGGLIGGLKAFAKRHWPALRLRAILLSVLLFAAALPGFGAVFLRVYENTMVRQTEAELIAQGAALVATAEATWKDVRDPPPRRRTRKADLKLGPGWGLPNDPDSFYRPEPLTIDLRGSRILPERPQGETVAVEPDTEAIATAKRIEPVVRETGRTTLASIRMIDANGIVVMGARDVGLSYARLPEVRVALTGRTVTLLRHNGAYRQRYPFEWLSRASSIRVHQVRPIVLDGKVVGALLLSRSPRGLFVGVYQDRGKILVGVAVIFLLLVGIAAVLSRAIARPIEALSAATDEVARGGTAIPATPATAAVEIRALYDNFAVMAARIERRSRYLRDFAAAVSHEFKTPIAGIKGAIELLDEHGAAMSEDERGRFLANAAADADRLSHLVQRLLDLARADMAVSPEDVATELAPPVRRVADARRSPELTIETDLPDSLPPVAVPSEAIEAALETLIENSLHAGATRVTLSARRDYGRVLLQVSDDGHGVPPGDRERLFEPFFTSRRAEGGSGLGLAIIRSLFVASGATIEYSENGAEAGSCFVLTLPVAETT